MVIMRTGVHVIGRLCVLAWRAVRMAALLSYLVIMAIVWPFLIMKYVFGKNDGKTLHMIRSTNKSIKSAARAL